MPISTDFHFIDYGYRLRDERVPEHTASNYSDDEIEDYVECFRDDLMDAIAQSGADSDIRLIVHEGLLRIIGEVEKLTAAGG